MPIQYETEGASINLINRYPETGEPVVEMEVSDHVFLEAAEAEALGSRLIAHAAVLRLP
jgi:hypothetical protein